MVAPVVRILHLGLAVTGAMALLAVRPKVQLVEDEVKIAVSPDDLLAALLAALLARGPVKRAFETHVHRPLDALATELAGYPDTGHPDSPMHAQ